MELMGKLFIDGKIKTLTGLHIGGSETDVRIGDIDDSVIKDSRGVPYIPGSSLKGKIRSLLERSKLEEILAENKASPKEEKGSNICMCGEYDICVIFGTAADKNSGEAGPTRLIVRDCYLTEETKLKMERKEGEFKELELIYTESKWENVIDRLTSRADHPRQTERVPRGAEFDFQMVFNLMEEKDIERFYYLISGLNLLEDDYLGGNGSRGYGRIEFTDLQIAVKTIADYQSANEAEILYTGTLKDFSKEKDDFKKKLMKKLELNNR